jgi:hypothetical protein
MTNREADLLYVHTPVTTQNLESALQISDFLFGVVDLREPLDAGFACPEFDRTLEAVKQLRKTVSKLVNKSNGR